MNILRQLSRARDLMSRLAGGDHPDRLIQKGILAANLFDHDWYVAQHPDVPPGEALKHFLRTGWKQGHAPGPDFDAVYYLAANPDVAAAGVDPLLHYVTFGRREGRATREPEPEPFSAAWLRPRLALFQIDTDAAQKTIDDNRRGRPWPRLAPGSAVAVFIHSGSNIFMREIAELFTAGLVAAGMDAHLGDERAVLLDDGAAAPAVTLSVRVIVAPHEFFRIATNGRVVPAEWAKDAILLNVEQLHTDWFRHGLEPLRRAAAVLDINLASAALLASCGFPADYLPLGHVAGFPRFGPQPTLPDVPALETLERAIKVACPAADTPLSERPIDIFFIGYLSPRRAGIFERMAQRLSRWRCQFVLTDADHPQVSGRNAVLESEATIGLAQRSKIILNFHQTEDLFFEWHRIVLQGIWQRTLVISEPLAMQTSFSAGEHFLEVPIEEIADVIDWVLGTSAGRSTAERVRTSAYNRLTQHVQFGEILRSVFSADSTCIAEQTTR